MNKHESDLKLKCHLVRTAATATVLSRQNPDDVISGRCQKYSDATHLRDITKTQHSKIKRKNYSSETKCKKCNSRKQIRNFLLDTTKLISTQTRKLRGKGVPVRSCVVAWRATDNKRSATLPLLLLLLCLLLL
jgi:hypothetical protein